MGIFQREVLKFKESLKGNKGQLGPLGLVLPLVLIFGMAVVAIIIMSTVSAKTYTSVKDSLTIPQYGSLGAVTHSSTIINADLNTTTENAFETYNQATQNLPLLAIIAVAFVVLASIARFMVFTGGSGGASAL